MVSNQSTKSVGFVTENIMVRKARQEDVYKRQGSGKSTCMNIIGCLDVPTHGTYRLNGKDVGRMSRNELASVRNEMPVSYTHLDVYKRQGQDDGGYPSRQDPQRGL